MTDRITDLKLVASVCTQLPGDEAQTQFWQETLTLSIQSIADNIQKMNSAATDKNADALSHSAHKLNGTVAFVGCQDLSKRLAALQKRCHEPLVGSLDEVPGITADLQIVILELEAAKRESPLFFAGI